MVWDGFHHETGPNSDLYSENERGFYIKYFRNIEISMNMATGGIEAHSNRPRHLRGIGSRLGHPSKYQSRPHTSRNRVTAPQATFHA
jgi:hypothetical protein